jgi:hypothetical protein
MEVVVDFEYLTGRQNEIFKEMSVAAKKVSDSFRFKIPCIMMSHGSQENGLIWEDGHSIPRIVHYRERGGCRIR